MIRLTTLGSAEILIGDVSLTPAAERAFALLLYLCLARGRSTQRATLQALLFSDGLNQDEGHSLRQLVYKLRRFGVPLENDAAGIALATEIVHDDAREVVSRGWFTDAQLDAIGHGYLGSYAPSGSEAFTAWLDEQRAAMSMQLRRVLVAQTAIAKERHDWPAVDRAARACLALDPLNEAAMLALSEALAMIGSKAQAIARLDSYMAEIGPGARALKTQAATLKHRIAERMPPYSPAAIGEVVLVGRDLELRRLVDALAAVRAGRPEIVRLSGEAGVGKTRLVEEFARLAALGGASVVTIHVRSSDEHRPLSAFYDAVRQLLTLPGAIGCSPDSMQFLTRFARLRGDPGIKIDEIERESEVLFANITAAIHDLLAAVGSEAPLALIVEDAHWLDAHSMQVIEESLRYHEMLPVCIVLTSRAATPASSERKASAEHGVNLTPLDASSSARLVDLLLRSPERTPAELRAWLVRTAAGSPLYARLLVQHFETTGQAFDVPISLSRLIGIRLDELSPTARKIIEAVTVLGRYATVERLQRLLELRQIEFLSALQELESRRLLLENGATVCTAHGLLEDNVVEKMTPVVVKVLHREVAALLESEIVSDSAHVPWDCAQHWTKAGEPVRAIAAMRTCARQALALGQSAEACAVLERLEERQSDEDTRIAILEEIVEIAEATVESRFVGSAASKLLATGSESLTRPRQEYALLRLEALHRSGIDSTCEQDVIRQIISDESLKAPLRLRAATLALARADEAIHLNDVELAYQVGSELIDRRDDVVSELGALGFRLVYDASFGDMDRASTGARRLIEVSRLSTSPGMRCRCQINGGIALFRAGLPAESEAALLAAREEAANHGLHRMHITALNHLCECARWLGDRSDAKKYLTEADAFLLVAPGATAGPLHCWNRAVDFMLDGHFNEADILIRESEARFPAIRTGKKRLGCEALRLSLRMSRDEQITLVDVTSVVALYEQAKSLWLDDIIVTAISAALAYCGESEQSTGLLSDYVRNWRRSKLPFPTNTPAT